jgi:CHAT domain-containing protein
VLQYAVTSLGTYIFLVTRSGLEVAKSDVNTERLDYLVDAYLSELKGTASSNDAAAIDYLKELGRALYTELISRIKPKLGSISSLCIVPDKSLHYLPFAALVDEQGHYLIDSYRLSSAPSSSVLVRSIKGQAGAPAVIAEKIVSVGNPSFDSNVFSDLKDLPDAAIEAKETAALYGPGNGMVLTGPAATKARILSELKGCDVAHLALHCLIKDDSPWRAALVVAASEKSRLFCRVSGRLTHAPRVS